MHTLHAGGTLKVTLPSSSSHAIIGGIMGSVFAHAGLGALKMDGLKTIILALVLSLRYWEP